MVSTKLTSIFVTSSRTGETARLPEECRTNTPSILSLKFLKKFPFTHSLPRGRSHTLNQFQIPSLPFNSTSQTPFYVSFFQTSTRNERRKKRKQLEKFIKYKLIHPLSCRLLRSPPTWLASPAWCPPPPFIGSREEGIGRRVGWANEGESEGKGKGERAKRGWLMAAVCRVEYQPTRSPGRAPALVRLRLNSRNHVRLKTLVRRILGRGAKEKESVLEFLRGESRASSAPAASIAFSSSPRFSKMET